VLPRSGSRLAQGLVVGLLVTAGFLAVFAVIGLPIIYGATSISKAVPWIGVAIGVVLVAVGLFALSGRPVALPVRNPWHLSSDRRPTTMVMFGAGYALASLGCTPPVFLAMVGASAGSRVGADSLAVFAAYGTGMAVVLMALSVSAALVQEGLARGVKRLLPHMGRVAGGLLVVAGGYLTYHWLRVRLGPQATLSSDPLVGSVTKFSARIESLASGRANLVLAGAGVVVAVAVATSLWQHRRARVSQTAESRRSMAALVGNDPSFQREEV